MNKTLLALIAFLAVPLASAQDIPMYPKILIETNRGDITLELDTRRAPITVINFIQYVQSGHYDGTIFHRVIPGFMIQGGGFTEDFEEKATGEPIPNESGNGLSNVTATVAMARTGNPHSATSQFFINVVDNDRLDPSPQRWGYAVFGSVVGGMEVVQEIVSIPTGPGGPFPSDAPQTPVVIEKVSLVE